MKTFVSLLAAAVLFSLGAQAQNWSVTSPSGLVKVSVQLVERPATAPFPAGPSLIYRVEHGTEGSRVVVIQDSPLGLALASQQYVSGLRFKAAQPLTLVQEAYEMPHGKRKQCHNRANQMTLSFLNGSDLPIDLDLRAYDDGVAFRYRLRLADGANPVSTPVEMEKELTGFALPPQTRLWMAPSDKASTYSPGYETYYENGITLDTVAPLGLGWSFPVLFHTPEGRWGLITEANVNASFCGTRLSSQATNGVYRIEWPNPAEGNAYGPAKPASTLPWEMPWRVIILGDSLSPIVESTLVQDVCPPSKVTDQSWIKPGRVAWSWWSDQVSPTDGVKQKKFVDLAVAMGWEYVLVDANWDLMDNGNVHDVLRYAKSKGIGVLLWYNSGGPHNVVTEKPRDTLTYTPVRRFELELLKKWGVKGIKVDFFQSDKQNVIGLYQDLLRDAAEFQIMLNFHGCTLPRGWERTWPHLMAMEAVRGEECYIFDPKFPEMAPTQNTITPFTRNAVGPMDYTPVGFSDNNNPHRTTVAHELALAVVFESGWVHFTDKAEAYLGLPDAPKNFLKQVPVTWDETRFVAGYPGQFVILARRKGDTWYVAGVNGQKEAREQQVATASWLPEGSYELKRIGDGKDARSFDSQAQILAPGQGFTVKMLPYGGFVATLKKTQ